MNRFVRRALPTTMARPTNNLATTTSKTLIKNQKCTLFYSLKKPAQMNNEIKSRPKMQRQQIRMFGINDDKNLEVWKLLFIQNAGSADKTLNREQFENICNLLGVGDKKTTTDKVFAEFDKDHSDDIDLEEFIKMCIWVRDYYYE